jgi:RNA polymerase sigma factor (sigma-70 family)
MHDRQLLESALLVVRYQRGDRGAFEGIVKLWESSLFYYLRRLAATEADAWELLQETWLKLCRSLATLRDPHTLPAFLYTTARNTAVSRLRKRELVEVESYPEVTDDAAANPIDAFDHADEVHHALDQLPLVQREALTLYFLEDLSLDEMAETLGVPVGTVKSRLHYGKREMRRILEGRGTRSEERGRGGKAFATEITEGTEKEEVRCKK